MISGDTRRIDSYSGETPRSIVITDGREIRSYDPVRKTCSVVPMPAGGLPGVESILLEGVDAVPEREDIIGGRRCTCFRIVRQSQTYDTSGNPVLQIEWSDIELGPPDPRHFEPMTGYKVIDMRR